MQQFPEIDENITRPLLEKKIGPDVGSPSSNAGVF